MSVFLLFQARFGLFWPRFRILEFSAVNGMEYLVNRQGGLRTVTRQNMIQRKIPHTIKLNARLKFS